jgi:restriction endonuclease S subunit
MVEKLTDIATVQSGFHFTERIENEKSGRVRFIQLKDIDEYNMIQYSALWKSNIQNIRPNHFLEAGDILIKSRGNNFTASVYESDGIDTIATSHFFVIRLNKKSMVLPDYLAWYLNDDITQKFIKLGTVGTYMLILNKKHLENVQVSIPSMEIQNKVIQIKKLSLKEKTLLKRKIELKTKLIDLELREAVSKG